MTRGGVAADERAFAGRQLVQQHAEREQVGAVIDGRALQLLRRHVRHRPDDGAFGRQRGGARADVGLAVGAEQAAGRQLRQPEVEHLHAPFRRDHHVGGFQVAVDDALLVRGGERIGERDADFADLRDGQPSGPHPQAEAVALHQLHRDEADAVGFLRPSRW